MFFANWLKNIFCRNKVPVGFDLSVVGDSERIVRFLLSPLHFRNGRLRSNAFNPSVGSDEISVNRLEIISIERTKPIAKGMAVANSQGEYCGFALHTKSSAMSCGVRDVKPDALENNKAHAEIKLGIVRKDLEIPAEIMEIKDKLTERSKLLLDPNPEEDGWSGPEPIYQ